MDNNVDALIEREDKYAKAMRLGPHAVMAVADGEMAALRAEVAELRSQNQQHLAYIKSEGEAFARFRDEWIASGEALVRKVAALEDELESRPGLGGTID